MPYEVVTDTSPLQYLHVLGLLRLLPQLYGHVLVPGSVVTELDVGRSTGLPLPDPRVFPWITIAEPQTQLPGTAGLGAGEAAVISLAVERSAALVLLDDHSARERAKALGLRVTGVLGVLLSAKHEGHLSELRPYLASLRHAGFRMSDELEGDVCRLAGEADP
jgi:uncharacterized protein